jgi:O-antigen/teichoic acid export membrane protein
MSNLEPPENCREQAQAEDAVGRKIALNTMLLGATEFLTRFLSLALIILVARFLGAAALGIYAFALSLTRIGEIFLNFGLDRYLQREAAREPGAVGPLFAQVFVFKTGLSLVCLAVIFGFSWTLVQDPLKRQVLGLLTLALLFRGHTVSAASFFRARQKAAYEAGVVITFRLLYGLTGVAALWAGQGLLTLVLLETTAQAGACLVALWLFWSRLASPWHRVTWGDLGRLVKAAHSFFLLRVLLTLANSTPLVLLSWLAGDLATGFYAAALRLTSAFDFLPEAFSGSFLPALSRQVRESWQSFVSVFQYYFKYLLILGLGLAAGLGSLAPGLIPLVFGSPFQPAVPVLTLLALALALEFVNLSCSNALIALNEEKALLWSFSCLVLGQVIFNLWFIPVLGATGAAIAALLAEFLVLLLQLRALGRHRLASLALVSLAWRPLGAGIVSFLGGALLTRAQLPLPWSLPLTGLFFLVALMANGALSRHELKTLKAWAGGRTHEA